MRKKNEIYDIESGYWLVLEPYTFVFSGNNGIVLFNSLNNDFLDVKEEIIKEKLVEFIEISNLYVVYISERLMKRVEFKNFTRKIKKGFFGDIFPLSKFPNKPVIIPPKSKIRNSIENLKKDKELKTKKILYNFLHEVTFYLNGICKQNCTYCEDYYKQFTYCTKTKSKSELNFYKFKKVVKSFLNFDIYTINISGGNIFLYKNIKEVIDYLNEFSYNKTYYVNYLNSDENIIDFILENKLNRVVIQVNFPIDKIILLRLLKKYINNLFFEFIVRNEKELNNYSELLKHVVFENVIIRPFYKDNLTFFTKNVFLNYNDIKSNSNSKKDIFLKDHINQFDYGKLIFKNDGKIYTNFNYKPVGIIGDNLLKIVERELSKNSSWFRTRNEIHPCNMCKFRLLCPSPSNYELVIGQNNLCLLTPQLNE